MFTLPPRSVYIASITLIRKQIVCNDYHKPLVIWTLKKDCFYFKVLKPFPFSIWFDTKFTPINNFQLIRIIEPYSRVQVDYVAGKIGLAKDQVIARTVIALVKFFLGRKKSLIFFYF